MNILVRQENYAWSFSDYQHVIIYHFVIKNLGPPLADAWVGLYSEMASGSKNSYTTWPPTGSGSHARRLVQQEVDRVRRLAARCSASTTAPAQPIPERMHPRAVRRTGWASSCSAPRPSR